MSAAEGFSERLAALITAADRNVERAMVIGVRALAGGDIAEMAMAIDLLAETEEEARACREMVALFTDTGALR